MTDPFNLLTEDWLKANGFKWHQFDRQPEKHWLLWLGDAMGKYTSYEDLGIEVCDGGADGTWFCWLRGDSAGRYHRFIHIRHIETVDDLTGMISGMIGYPFDPANALYGHLYSPVQAAAIRAEDERRDQRMRRDHPTWYLPEKDDTLGGPLIEHLTEHEKRRAGEEE